MQNPLLSVVVPSYCHETYISDCLASIYEQTYNRIELVIVDDASSDSTFSVASNLVDSNSILSERFENIILVQNESNIGAHATINKGIALTTGQYIALINSDDLYTPTRLSRMIDELMSAEGQLAFSLVEAFHNPSDGEMVYPHDFLLYALRQKLAITRDPTVGYSLLRQNIAVSTGNLLFSRALYEKVGPFRSLKYCHDWDFVLQSAFYAEPVAVLEPLYLYRLHRNNSFQTLAHRAAMETEVVYRRFLRRGLTPSPNKLFPSALNWPGFFEVFLQELEKTHFYRLENGEGSPNWRVYNGRNT